MPQFDNSPAPTDDPNKAAAETTYQDQDGARDDAGESGSASAGWFTAVGLGVLLLMGSIAWTITANRPSRIHVQPSALARISAAVQGSPQILSLAPSRQATQTMSAASGGASAGVPAGTTASATPASQAQPPTGRASVALPGSAAQVASATTPASAQAPAAASSAAKTQDQDQEQEQSETVATSAESAPKARRRPKPKPARPRVRAEKPDPIATIIEQASKNNRRAAATPASAPGAPASPPALCSGDSIAKMICLMRECDKPANAHVPQCVQLQQRANALRNDLGNRPYL